MNDLLTPAKIVKNLIAYNEYRRGSGTYQEMELSPHQIGKTIDAAIRYINEHEGLENDKLLNAEKLMKKCRTGVSGRNAVNVANNILAECYGMIGILLAEIKRLKWMDSNRMGDGR
jgi:hypothetical protein